MESEQWTKLTAFHDSVTAWPTTEEALKEITSECRKVLGLSWVLMELDHPKLHALSHSTLTPPIPELKTLGPYSVFSIIGMDAEQPYDLGRMWIENNPNHSTQTEILAAGIIRHLGHLGIQHQKDEAIAARDQFLSIASHELKTPLTAIFGILQLQERMLKGKKGSSLTPDEEKQLSFFKIVLRQVARLNELIDALLDVSRIQGGRFTIEPIKTNVAAILRETIQSRLNLLAQEAEVHLEVHAPDSLLAWIDPLRFEEVVSNLVMNAIRFSPEGGLVTVDLKAHNQDEFVLSIRDQGPPLNETDRVRIFYPFQRVERTGRLGGLGLGLFISRQIAQLHGGDVILAQSTAGKGNLFEARFPIKLSRK